MWYYYVIGGGFMVFNEKQKDNIQKIQDVEIKILEELDRICKKYNLEYSVAGGTLLGAVRHNDFIPWDDDIDVDLRREDFQKLLEVLPTELSDEFEFVNYSDFGECFCDFIPRIFYNKCKVRNSFSSPDGENNLANDPRLNGIFIELYCLHDTTSKTVKKQIMKTKIIYGLAMGHRYFRFSTEKYSFVEKAEVFILSTIGKLIPLKTIFEMYEKNCNMVSAGEGEMFFKPSVPLPVQERNVFDKSLFSGFEYHKMRNAMVKIPGKYEAVLELLYGDWRQLPPEKDRKPSHFNLDEVAIY